MRTSLRSSLSTRATKTSGDDASHQSRGVNIDGSLGPREGALSFSNVSFWNFRIPWTAGAWIFWASVVSIINAFRFIAVRSTARALAMCSRA